MRRRGRHLAAHGHTRIAFLGEGDGGEGLAGYRAGLEAAGLVLDPALVVADLADAALADAAVGTLFRTTDPPTALFTARDAVTVAALRALHRLGLQRLVAVVGFGDFVTADLLSRESPSSPRTPPASADGPRTCCSRGWRARPGRPRPTTS